MVTRQFPDLNMVRQLRNEAPMGTVPAWNNIALNVKCREASRTGVESPYSLFINNSGHSLCRVDGRNYRVETDTFLLSRPGEQYDLVIDNLQQTEIFNIHINRDYFHQRAWELTNSDARLLDAPHTSGSHAPYLNSQLYAKDMQLQLLLHNLQATTNKQSFDLSLDNIICYLLSKDEDTRREMAAIPAVTAAVRQELLRRVSYGRDIIRSCYMQELDLDMLCRETAMSRFHFLRTFKAVYGVTPFRYLAQVRLAKAQYLLQTTALPINTIASEVGFAYSNSFIKLFTASLGISPLQYRKATGKFSNIG